MSRMRSFRRTRTFSGRIRARDIYKPSSVNPLTGVRIKLDDPRRWKMAAEYLHRLPADIQHAIDQTIEQEAKLFVKLAEATLLTGGRTSNSSWKPNKQVTIRYKKGRRILSDTQALSQSMYIKKEGASKYRLLFKGGGGRSAEKMHTIAMAHEFGAKIVKQPSKAEYAAIMIKLREAGTYGNKSSRKGKKRGFVVIRIPRRPFLRDTRKAHFSGRPFSLRVRMKMQRNLARYRPMMTAGTV